MHPEDLQQQELGLLDGLMGKLKGGQGGQGGNGQWADKVSGILGAVKSGVHGILDGIDQAKGGENKGLKIAKQATNGGIGIAENIINGFKGGLEDLDAEAMNFEEMAELEKIDEDDIDNLSDEEIEALFDFGKIGDMLDKVKEGAHKVLGGVASLTHNKDLANVDKMATQGLGAAEDIVNKFKMGLLDLDEDE